MTEQSLRFGSGNGLVGTICVPPAPASAGPAIGYILFNAGVVHRIGPHRINVRLARKLAGRGIPSIRFDLAGLGDSKRPDGQHSFEAQAVIDVKSAMDALESATQATRFVLFGFCSGAYHSYATALADERVAGLLLFDGHLYVTYRSRINHYLLRIRERGLWHAFGGWFKTIATRQLRVLFGLWQDAQPVASVRFIREIPEKAEFASGLESLVQRGVSVRILYSGGNFEYDSHCNYSRQFADAFRRFPVVDRIAIDFFPDLDHVITSLDGQREFMRRIEDSAGKNTRPGSEAAAPRR